MDLEKLLKDLKVLQEGHFILNSGLHSQYYFEKFRILENPVATTKLCSLIVKQFKDPKIEWVIGPTTGGVIIAFETARQLGCRAGFAEERDGKRVVARGFDIKGKNILIVDDVLTTGKSIQETIQAVNGQAGNITGIAVLIDRHSKPPAFEFFSPYRKDVVTYAPDQCPLCKANVPLTRLGGA
ncbi:MAG TPA: orotate phosphoribosyltransferase [bacterium]